MASAAQEPKRSTGASSRARNRWGQGDRLREEILEAAQRLLEGGSSEGQLSLRAIAREAGVAAPSIYRHFAGTTEIVWEVLALAYTRLIHAMDDARDGLPPDRPRDRLDAMARAYSDFALERPRHYHLMFGVDQRAVPLDRLREHPVQRVLDVWTQAVAALYDPRPEDLSQARELGLLVWTSLHGQVGLWLALPIPGDLDTLAEHRRQLLNRLLGSL